MRLARAIILLILVSMASAMQIDTGVELSASNADDVYEVATFNLTGVTFVDFNSTAINFTFGNTSAVVTNTTGVRCTGVTSCEINETGDKELLYVYNFFISDDLNITNMTGNLTNITVCYSAGASQNMTIVMTDVNGDCNYGIFAGSDLNDSISGYQYPRSLFRLDSCTIVIQTNTTAGNYCFDLYIDQSISDNNSSSVLFTNFYAISLIWRVRRWASSVTTTI